MVMEFDWETVYSRMKIVREDILQLNREKMAEKIGYSADTYRKYERGALKPSLEVIFKIASIANVSSDWLLGLTNDRSRTPSAIDELGLTEESALALREIAANRNRDDEDEVYYYAYCYVNEILSYSNLHQLFEFMYEVQQAYINNDGAKRKYPKERDLSYLIWDLEHRILAQYGVDVKIVADRNTIIEIKEKSLSDFLLSMMRNVLGKDIFDNRAKHYVETGEDSLWK